MKTVVYTYPHSGFLATEKDTALIVNMILKNENLKKMLHYPTADCLQKPRLSEEETFALFGNQIKIVPQIRVDEEVQTYLLITFDDFVGNATNPEFRDSIIYFDIVCPYDQWHLKDFELRPFKIAGELDSMFNDKHLTGIGTLQFMGARRFTVNDHFGGLCVMYNTVHGGEDRKHMPNPVNEEQFIENFDAMFNDK